MLFLIKLGEIALKRGNRGYFEKKLMQNIKRRLRGDTRRGEMQKGRFYVEVSEDAVVRADAVLSSTFGVVAFAPTIAVGKTYEKIKTAALQVCGDFLAQAGSKTFKVAARRSDKSFAMDSYQIAQKLGDDIRYTHPRLSVDVHSPDLTVHVEVRDRVYIYGNEKRGLGGLPVGTAEKGVLLLSGGIDSPVAAFLMARRGLRQDAVYFHTYPFTSQEAEEKAEAIAGILAPSFNGINLFSVPFTDIASRIREKAPPAEMTLLMRACMMSTAAKIAERQEALCLVTGESLSQVASQTVQSMRFTGGRAELPVFRPLVGMGKEEIINLARRIGTYETSILPFEDCCTVFAPKKPLIRPDLERMNRSYHRLEIGASVDAAVEQSKRTWFGPST